MHSACNPFSFIRSRKWNERKKLKEREQALKAKEQRLKDRKASLEERERLLEERERVSRAIANEEPEERPLSKDEQKLITEALKVYKIPREYLFHARIDPNTGEAVIVTNGGKKLRHRKGEEAKLRLTEVQITGERPKEEMVWHKKLNQRIPLKGLFKRP